MVTTAAQMAAYLYPEEEDPEGAFSWWLSPCGGTDLVPDDIKNAFAMLSTVANGVSSFSPPRKLKKHSRRRGDEGNPNPTDRGNPRTSTNSGVQKPAKKCRIGKGKSTFRVGGASNTLRKQSCVSDQTVAQNLVVTSLAYAAPYAPVQYTGTCRAKNSQACYHYSSAIRVNPQWATITCDDSIASVANRLDGHATATWAAQHKGKEWREEKNRARAGCDMDEYPPAHLLHDNHPAFINGGLNTQGQLVRFLDSGQNRACGSMWKGVCMKPVLMELSDADFARKFLAAPSKVTVVDTKGNTVTKAAMTVTHRPEFTMVFEHASNPPVNDGHNDNQCWPSGIAANDPGFPLLTFDPYYRGMAPPYDYAAPYVKGSNGS
jgi:hypothetical protein